MKTCCRCHIEKSLTLFHKDKSKKDGHCSTCKQCISKSDKERYLLNSESIKARSKQWSIENIDKMRAYSREWCRKNYSTVKAQFKQWRIDNPERSREHNRSRRAKMQAISPDLIAARFSVFGNACAYCGLENGSLEVDHVIPLANGGKHIPANIRPACRTCNGSKAARKLSDWILDPSRLTGQSL